MNAVLAPMPLAREASAQGDAATAIAERMLCFPCEGEQLLGTLHLPASHAGTAPTLGVVVVVGGPQVRVGSHRQFVHLARALADAGHPVLRFDVRGMGDSTGTPRSFEQIGSDIGAAIDALMCDQTQLQGVVLWGLCDGASASLLYLHERADPRVHGLCLVNPWARSEVTEAQVQVRHYYVQRLVQPGFWRKLMSGGVGLQALREFWTNLTRIWKARAKRTRRTSSNVLPFGARMARAWQAFSGPILLLLSANDFTAREFETALKTQPVWNGAMARANLQTQLIADADHTLSERSARQTVERLCIEWLDKLEAPSLYAET